MATKLRRSLQKFCRAMTNSTDRTMSLRKHMQKRAHLMQHVKKIARRGQARRGRGTWTGMQQGRQTRVRRTKEKRMRQGIAISRRGALSGEVTAGETKVRQRRPHAHWGFPGAWPED